MTRTIFACLRSFLIALAYCFCISLGLFVSFLVPFNDAQGSTAHGLVGLYGGVAWLLVGALVGLIYNRRTAGGKVETDVMMSSIFGPIGIITLVR